MNEAQLELLEALKEVAEFWATLVAEAKAVAAKLEGEE